MESNIISTKNPGFLRNPQGKLIPDKFILQPNYQDIYYTKNQIGWGEGIVKHFEETDTELSSQFKEINQRLRKRRQKLAF